MVIYRLIGSMAIGCVALAAASAQAVRDTPPRGGAPPVVEARAASPSHVLAVVLSGDGDWADLVKTLARGLNEHGISVVGLKSRSYLKGAKRTPESSARDLAAILDDYLASWNADSVMVVGYSRGADIGPFMVARLPERLRSKVYLVALLSPSKMASFEFHLMDLFSNKSRGTDLPIRPEVDRLTGIRLLCVYGTEEVEDSLCPALGPGQATVVAKSGGHHLDKNYVALGELLVAEWREAR